MEQNKLTEAELTLNLSWLDSNQKLLTKNIKDQELGKKLSDNNNAISANNLVIKLIEENVNEENEKLKDLNKSFDQTIKLKLEIKSKIKNIDYEIDSNKLNIEAIEKKIQNDESVVEEAVNILLKIDSETKSNNKEIANNDKALEDIELIIKNEEDTLKKIANIIAEKDNSIKAEITKIQSNSVGNIIIHKIIHNNIQSFHNEIEKLTIDQKNLQDLLNKYQKDEALLSEEQKKLSKNKEVLDKSLKEAMDESRINVGDKNIELITTKKSLETLVAQKDLLLENKKHQENNLITNKDKEKKLDKEISDKKNLINLRKETITNKTQANDELKKTNEEILKTAFGANTTDKELYQQIKICKESWKNDSESAFKHLENNKNHFQQMKYIVDITSTKNKKSQTKISNLLNELIENPIKLDKIRELESVISEEKKKVKGILNNGSLYNSLDIIEKAQKDFKPFSIGSLLSPNEKVLENRHKQYLDNTIELIQNTKTSNKEIQKNILDTLKSISLDKPPTINQEKIQEWQKELKAKQIFSKKDGRLLKEVKKLNEILKPYIKIAENSTENNNSVKNNGLNKLHPNVH
jgi:hypothetical protein